MDDSKKKLRYYALRAIELINTLCAYDGSGIPSSDAGDAFAFLRELVESELSEKERSFGANHRPEIERLRRELKES